MADFQSLGDAAMRVADKVDPANDWADAEAQEILDTARGMTRDNEPAIRQWIAAKLRLVKMQGRCEGLRAASAAMGGAERHA